MYVFKILQILKTYLQQKVNMSFRKLYQCIRWAINHPFEALVIASIATILILALTRIRSKGSWASTYHYEPPIPRLSQSLPRRESSGEIRTRNFLESYFGKPFPKARPDFLVNPVTGSRHNLELDCYNSELQLAAEYNGAQHYKYIPFFHKNKEAFYNQKYRDELKRIRCRELGITLIEIPYTEERRLEQFIARELVRLGYRQP
jgi:hypothetical protein